MKSQNQRNKVARRGNSTRVLATALSATLIIAICGATGCGKKDEASAAADETAVLVSARSAYREDAVQVVSATGSLVADKQVTVFSPVSGRITGKRVDLGSAVRTNQVLIVVDHAALDAAVQQSQAAVSSSEQQAANLATEFARVQRLYAEGGASQSQFDAIRTQKTSADEGVKQMRAMLEQATIRRNDAEVRAPFTGLIGKMFVEIGDMVGPGVPLAIVTAPSPLIAKVQIAERDLGAIRPSQTTAVSVASYPTENFSGTIRRISPMLDPITRMAELEVLLPNSDQRLKAGMFARIKIEVDRRENALMVPSNAVLQEARLQASGSVSDVARTSFLFIVQGDKAVRKNVTLGYTTGDRVEILSGIAPEDNIIIQGQSFLQNGQRVALLSK